MLVDPNRARIGLVEALKKRGDGRLPASRRTDDRNTFALLDFKADIFEYCGIRLCGVAELDVVERDVALDREAQIAFGLFGIEV